MIISKSEVGSQLEYLRLSSNGIQVALHIHTNVELEVDTLGGGPAVR